MRRIIMVLCVFMLVASLGTGLCLAASGDEKPVIVTTIYPLYDFTKQVVGDKAKVVLLTPAGAEPHDWEPSPADLVTIQKSNVFIYNGAGMESWVDKISGTLTGIKVVNASDSVAVMAAEFDEDGGPAAAGALDPHIWLDPVNASTIVGSIGKALAENDPANASYYENNTAVYQEQLAALNQQYADVLRGKTSNEIVTSHAAFGYMAKRYGFKQIAIMGLTPDAEPTPDKMVQIIQHVKDNNIKYIFFETLVNPKLSETIANETGAQTLVFNPIEGLTDQEIAQGQNYITEMQMNLVNLKYALGVTE